MSEQGIQAADEPDDAHGVDTGHEEGRSDEVEVEPGAKGPGAATGTGAGRTGGLPGQGYHPGLAEDEIDDTIGGLEPYEDAGSATKPYDDHLDRGD